MNDKPQKVVLRDATEQELSTVREAPRNLRVAAEMPVNMQMQRHTGSKSWPPQDFGTFGDMLGAHA